MRFFLILMAATSLGGCVTTTNVAAASGGGGTVTPRQVVLVRRTTPIFVVASGTRARLATMFSLNPDCSLNDYLTVRILALPTHGKATVERGRFYPTYAKNNQRSVCNSQPADGTAAWYQSAPGYVGDDAVELEIIGTSGGAARATYHIEVK